MMLLISTNPVSAAVVTASLTFPFTKCSVSLAPWSHV